MNRATAMKYSFAGQKKSVAYAYGADGLKETATLLSGAQRTTTYDTLNRETAMSIGNLKRTVSYLGVSGNRTTTLPSNITYKNGSTTLLSTGYTYDVLGNLATMTIGGTTYTYTYDSLNQLKTVSDGTNSYTYNYNTAGNITSKVVNGTTISYGYVKA